MARRERLDAEDLVIEAQMKAAEIASHTALQLRRCSTGKRMYPRASGAANLAKHLRHRNRDPFLQHYHCDKCGCWHIGHAPGSQSLKRALLETTTP